MTSSENIIRRRVEFTQMLVKLVIYAKSEGLNVFIDYVKRSAEDQYRLFKEGKSKCDGYKVLSRHQLGLAADIYIVNEDGQLDFNHNDYDKLHEYWEKMGGRKKIEWDIVHFEV